MASRAQSSPARAATTSAASDGPCCRGRSWGLPTDTKVPPPDAFGSRGYPWDVGRFVRLAFATSAALACACSTADLEVLDPGASREAGLDAADASAANDAPGDRDGDSGALESGGDGSADVSSDADAGGGVGCKGTSAPCSVAGQCCSLSCVSPGVGGDGRICGQA